MVEPRMTKYLDLDKWMGVDTIQRITALRAMDTASQQYTHLAIHGDFMCVTWGQKLTQRQHTMVDLILSEYIACTA